MALSDLQNAIMRDLRDAGGRPIGMPVQPPASEDDVMTAIEGLQRLQYVRVVGPPNGNSLIGQDVDELHLRPFGVSYIRTSLR